MRLSVIGLMPQSFRTLNVEVYQLARFPVRAGNARFRTLNVEVYQTQIQIYLSCLKSFRTLNVEVYRIITPSQKFST